MICAATEQMGRSMENLEGLPVFVRAVREGSFSSAARVLGLTPSAVSKQIGRLEDQLAVRLLNRTTRRLSLPEGGAAFYARARSDERRGGTEWDRPGESRWLTGKYKKKK